MRYIRRNIKDQKLRENYNKNESKKNLYKMLRRNELLSVEERSHFSKKINEMPTSSSISRIQNRCIITGRSKGIISAYKLSRIQFKEYIKLGLITGIKKLSY